MDLQSKPEKHYFQDQDCFTLEIILYEYIYISDGEQFKLFFIRVAICQCSRRREKLLKNKNREQHRSLLSSRLTESNRKEIIT